MRAAFALRIDSGIIILICISAKPAGLAEMFFHEGVVMVKWRFQTANAVYLCVPTCENAFVALRRVRQTRNKNNLSAEDAQSERGAHFQSLSC